MSSAQQSEPTSGAGEFPPRLPPEYALPDGWIGDRPPNLREGPQLVPGLPPLVQDAQEAGEKQ